MRRITTVTKEAFLWVRAQVAKTQEMQEHWQEVGAGTQTFKEIVEINEALIDSFRDTLFKLLSLELQWLFDEFNLSKQHALASGSAFPAYPEQTGLDESIVEYCNDIVSDVVELYTMPAIQIADEFEEWADELYNYHADKRDGAI